MERTRSRATLVWAALLGATVACSASLVPPDADPRPWERPVNGAVAATAWRDNGQPVGPFGPGGLDWTHPQQLIDAMATAMGQDGDLEVRSALASENRNGTVTGWVRIAGLDAPEIAADLRVQMRADAGSWVVVGLESRMHCAEPLIGDDCGG